VLIVETGNLNNSIEHSITCKLKELGVSVSFERLYGKGGLEG